MQQLYDHRMRRDLRARVAEAFDERAWPRGAGGAEEAHEDLANRESFLEGGKRIRHRLDAKLCVKQWLCDCNCP